MMAVLALLPPVPTALLLVGATLIWFLVWRPRRRGGPLAPPVVTNSPRFPIPILGVLLDFFSKPNALIQRCYETIGPVFTVPVSAYVHFKYTP